jgi:glycosyltransferase involved in cell wall biosynthesis
MKVLFLHSSSDLYGAGKILFLSVKMLQQQGYHPIVVLSSPGPLSTILLEQHIEVRFVRLGILRRKYHSLSGIINRFFTFRKAVKTLSEMVKKENITLIYSNTTAVLAGARVAAKTSTKHIWHVHEIIEQPKWLFQIISYLLNHHCDRIITVSDAVTKHWQQSVMREKITRIYNGIDYTPYSTPINESKGLRKELLLKDNQLLIGMIGRVHHWKGQDYFLEIAHHLLQKNKDIHFIMVGDAYPGNEYLYEHLNILKKKYKLDTHITDLGYRTDVADILKALDIFILPSTSPDPFPTVLLESMATGKAVAATAHGGAIEMIRNRQDGLLIPFDNASRAAEIIQEFIENADARNSMAISAQNRVMNTFSFEAYQKQLLETIRATIA